MGLAEKVCAGKSGVKKALFLLLLLSGCAVGPDYERPALEVSDDFKESPSGWKEAQPRDEISRGKWWEIFGDAELNALAERIEGANFTIAAAEAQVRQAEAALRIQRSGLFPQVDADASVTRSRSPIGTAGGTTAGRTVTNRSASLTAAWEPDLWGRVRRGVESGQASLQASAGDLGAARLAMQTELAASYFQLRLLDVQKQLLDDTVAAFRRSLELTQNRYNVGVVARVDVVQADAQVKSTLAQAADLGLQRAQLEHAIAVLIGLPPSRFSIAPRPSYEARLPPIPPGLPSALLERRPDVAAAERRVAAANAEIGVAKSAFFPALTLSGTFGYRTTEAIADWITAPSRFWSIGPAIALSVFDAGLRRAQTDQAIAAYDATVANYRRIALTAIAEVEDNLAALRILEEEARLQAEAVEAARRSVELTTNQYKAGIVSFLNVAQVQTTLLNEERAAVGVQSRLLTAAVGLVRALGGGWQQR